MDMTRLIRRIIVERSVACFSLCQDGLPRTRGSQEQTVWPRAAVGGANQDHVLGGVFLHDGQAKEGGARDQKIALLLPDRVSQKPG